MISQLTVMGWLKRGPNPRLHVAKWMMTEIDKTLKVGVAQLAPRLGNLTHNLEQHHYWLEQARRANVELLLFPELSLTGYGLGRQALAASLGRHDMRLLELSQQAPEITLAVGFVEQAAPGELYNAVALLQGGALLGVHRKINLPTYGNLEEGKLFGKGRNIDLSPIKPGWQAATLICADLWNPALAHVAMLKRPELLLAPIASAEGAVSDDFSNPDGWQLNLQFYGMTYGTPVVMANLCDSGEGIRFWGGSRIIDPQGRTLAKAGAEPELITAELSRTAMAEARFDLPTVRDADTELVKQLLENH